MRDRLYKAKRKDNNEWVEGYYSKSPHPLSSFLKDYIFAPYYDEVKECGYDNGYEINVDTICQYVGLTDIKKHKIWEYDIVKQLADCDELGKSLYYFYIIKWDDKYVRFYGEEIYSKETFLFDDLEDIEVIGNVFDNPELLEV